MIERKPFRIKGLRGNRLPKSLTKPTPKVYQTNTKDTPKLAQTDNDSRGHYELITSKREELIRLIVNNSTGVNAYEVWRLFKKFCDVKKYRITFDIRLESYNILKSLTDEGEITRIKLRGVYYYFPLLNRENKEEPNEQSSQCSGVEDTEGSQGT